MIQETSIRFDVINFTSSKNWMFHMKKHVISFCFSKYFINQDSLTLLPENNKNTIQYILLKRRTIQIMYKLNNIHYTFLWLEKNNHLLKQKISITDMLCKISWQNIYYVTKGCVNLPYHQQIMFNECQYLFFS